MADTTVDVGAVIGGIFLPGNVSQHVAEAYDDVLFRGAGLRQLPDDAAGKAPRFVINATNVQSAALWRLLAPVASSANWNRRPGPQARALFER